MIFHPYRCIFFHIGKAAGTSIERTFDPRHRDFRVPNRETFFGYDKQEKLYLQHATPAFMQQHVHADIFDRYFKFSVVRNPFSRLVSVYNYSRGYRKKYRDFEHYVLSLKQDFDVDDALKSDHRTCLLYTSDAADD